MLRLFQFVIKYQAFFIFLLLEVLCVWLIIRNNRYQNAAFLNSSNQVAGTIFNFNQNISSYFDLRKVNTQLVSENAQLQLEVARMKNQLTENQLGSRQADPLIDNYSFTSAKVVNNSTRRIANYLTLNKGLAQNVRPGMAVINSEGIVGKVKVASENFATVTSVLHPDVLTSCVLKKSNTVCTVKWDGRDPTKAQLLYVPRHVGVSEGDLVVTSGFNAIFPPDVPVGKITNITLGDEDTFYNIEIDFSTQFEQLSFVFVVGNALKVEKDSIENTHLQ